MFIEHPERALARVAIERGGVFTRRDAKRVELSLAQQRQRVRVGAWQELFPGVFANGMAPLDGEVRLRGALLFGGPTAAASHRSAGALWQLDGIQVPAQPEITVPIGRCPRAAELVVHRSTQLTAIDVTSMRGMRVTKPVRTVIDLASIVNEAALEIAFESARRRSLIAIPALVARLEQIGGTGRPGAAMLNQLINVLRGEVPAESALEVRVARLLRTTRLPKPVRQFQIAVEGSEHRVDFAWPEHRIVLECDGRAFHGDPTDFVRDRHRWSDLSVARWTVVVVTYDDVKRRSREVLQQLARAFDCVQ